MSKSKSSISPAIIRVKNIITDLSDFEDQIDPLQVERIAELLLLTDGMSINPIIVMRQGHDSKYTIYNGHETYAAALSLQDNPHFRGHLNGFIIGDNIGDADIEVIQRYLAVLRPPSISPTPIDNDNDNEMGKNNLERMDFDRIDPTPVGKTARNKPVSKHKKLSQARWDVINCLRDGLCRAREIATELHKKVGTIRAMLSKLVKSDLGVMRIRRGLYGLVSL